MNKLTLKTTLLSLSTAMLLGLTGCGDSAESTPTVQEQGSPDTIVGVWRNDYVTITFKDDGTFKFVQVNAGDNEDETDTELGTYIYDTNSEILTLDRTSDSLANYGTSGENNILTTISDSEITFKFSFGERTLTKVESESVAPSPSPLIGSWSVENSELAGNLLFINDTEYFYTQARLGADGVAGGVELGTYTFNNNTISTAFTTIIDTNEGDSMKEATLIYSADNDTITIPAVPEDGQDEIVLTRNQSESEPWVGAWSGLDSDGTGSLNFFTFDRDGTYAHAAINWDDPRMVDVDGDYDTENALEMGTYTVTAASDSTIDITFTLDKTRNYNDCNGVTGCVDDEDPNADYGVSTLRFDVSQYPHIKATHFNSEVIPANVDISLDKILKTNPVDRDAEMGGSSATLPTGPEVDAIVERLEALSTMITADDFTQNQLEAYLGDDFLDQEKFKSEWAKDVTDESTAWLELKNFIVTDLDTTAMTAKVTFSVFANGAEVNINTWKVQKTGDQWMILGNRQIVEFSTAFWCTKWESQEGVDVLYGDRAHCGAHMAIYDTRVTDNPEDAPILSAKVDVIRSGTVVSDSPLVMKSYEGGTLGDLYPVLEGGNQNYGGFTLDEIVPIYANDQLRVQLYNTSDITGDVVDTFYRNVTSTPVTTPSSSDVYPSISAETKTALESLSTSGGALTVEFTTAEGKKVDYVMYTASDTNGGFVEMQVEDNLDSGSVVLNIDLSSLSGQITQNLTVESDDTSIAQKYNYVYTSVIGE